MGYPDDLIARSRPLAQLDDRGRPGQANPRRAISAACYALFHEVVDRSAVSVLSGGDWSGPLGGRLRRTIGHQSALKAAKWFDSEPSSAPQAIQAMRTVGGALPPADPVPVRVRRSFIEL